jgi:phospholipid N-methyltransferase
METKRRSVGSVEPSSKSILERPTCQVRFDSTLEVPSVWMGICLVDPLDS